MGFEEDRFVDKVDEESKCSVCHGVLDNPLITPCGRVFCSGCVLPCVLQQRKCPELCCDGLTPNELKNVLDLRHNILKMQVKCDYSGRGCTEVVSLAGLAQHVVECDYRPVSCVNKGCTETLNFKDLTLHESDTCEFRPVGICQKGCGLVLLHHEAAGHDCLEALRGHLANQDLKMTTLEVEMKKFASKYCKREKSLLAQIGSLHSEIQMQALRFQRKLSEYRSQMAYLSKKVVQPKVCEETRLVIALERENGSLGFNIMGGYSPENSLSDGIMVSRITEGGPADTNNMQIHDQIVQVNGQDLSQATHEEAVEAFKAAKEPIVVEVLRRVTKGSKMKSRSPTMVSVGTQTDEFGDSIYYGMFRPPTPPPALFMLNGTGSLVEPASRKPVAFSPSAEMGLTDLEMANGLEYEEALYDGRPYDLEYEEVTLHRASSQEKVGLTLCYGFGDDEVTDIFVSEIEPCSIAAQDGRIREGDQILQINGIDVHSRDQAISLFAENRSDITLLLARTQAQMDDGFLEEQTLSDLHLEMLKQHHHLLPQPQDEEGGTTDTATTENSSNKHEKDSGVGRTDDSTRNDESSEQELLENECTSPGSQSKSRSSKCNLGSGDLHYSNDSFTSNEAQEPELASNEISAEECEKFREVLETRCSVENSPRHEMGRKDSQSSIEREIAQLNKEMEQIQLECQEIVEAHSRAQHKIPKRTEPFRSPRMVPRMGTKLEYAKQIIAAQEGQEPIWIKQHEHLSEQATQEGDTAERRLGGEDRDKEKDTSTTSAYNTGDSCRSTPLTLELNQSDGSGKVQKNSMLSLAAAKPSHSDSEKTAQKSQNNNVTKEWNSDGDGKVQGELSKSQSSGSVEKMSQTPILEERMDSLQDLYAQYADVMYTNHANLEHTIMVQQKLFQQQLVGKSHKRHTHDLSEGGAGCSLQSPTLPPNSSSMEWVVKRRADGTRYITRRPVRNRMLKERAKKIAEERTGLTTDDDAQSELKVGRYWSKEDRKRHIDKAKDHKRRKEFMLKARMETLKEQEDTKKEPNIVELSHRKMMKHKGKKVFDDFTTVQEMMAHGSKMPEGKTYNPLLSVTTV